MCNPQIRLKDKIVLTKRSKLSEIVDSLQTQKLDAKDYIREICRTIEKCEGAVQALIPEDNREERLLGDLAGLDNLYPNPEKRPPLFGVPVGVKDIFRTDGFETRAGSELPSELFDGKEASVVSKLKNAGALILGKTVSTEFAYFEPGPTRNPYHTEHTPGGSSSGSAASVACGYTPLALGTQTIGSITRPAAFCGIVGYKPSYNRIGKDGVIPFSTSADHVGLFTQDLDGIAIAASVVCENWTRYDNIDSVKPVIGVIGGKYLEQADHEILALFSKSVDALVEQGYSVKHLNIFENISEINSVHRKMISHEFSMVHKEWYENYGQLYHQASKDLIREGTKVTEAAYSESLAGRGVFRKFVDRNQVDNQIDFWLSPASTSTAPRGMATGSPLMNLPWTYAGLPTLTVPGGLSEKNLPFGLQFAGSFNEDEKLLNFTKAVSRDLGLDA